MPIALLLLLNYKDPIKKADNGTYYFIANLGYNPITGKQIQKFFLLHGSFS